MVSREHKRSALNEKLQILRSITHSHALNKTSIIVDATKFIKEQKQKVVKLNQENTNQVPLQVTVETLEKGFLINVFLEKSCPGLLVAILESFEELGLNVLQARVSCTDGFRLQAVTGKNGESGESIDAQVVKRTVLQAFKKWSETIELE
ncbi:hypothetical protein CFOL_v3_05990 [Cephalotus follicularis]|uniref:Plant bHLH transcription factor ACT-like domain-containing protein n=1 Tax=Cephalotus follicularis TaxID=3775 RepID=A0A1Q3B392_CEPFO|nr:hypothetical protein CFOL_v3_05990 [Cephalotus follicularis]